MTRQIEWSPRATKEYLNLIDYLLDEWGERPARKFANRLETILAEISERPKMYPVTISRRNVRRCVVSKQASLYYRIRNEKIELITIFDTRQNPSMKKL